MIGRFVDWLLVIGALTGLMLTSWWALFGGPNSAEKFEKHLQEQAQASLDGQGHGWARVEMDGQRALISGDAPAYDSLDRAVSIVMASSGFGGPLYGGVTVVDDAVAAAPPVSPYVWNAQLLNTGEIVLSGHVPSQDIMDELLLTAEALAPGEVVNNLSLGTGEPASGDWASVATKGLMQLEGLTEGQATLTDSRLDVSGIVKNDAGLSSIPAAMRGVDAPFSGDANVRGASLWTAQRNGDDLVLSGQVLNTAEKSELLALANEYHDGAVRDEMTVLVHEHTNWMTGARTILPHFARFETGEFAFDPSGAGYSLTGQASDSVLAYLREDTRGLDTGFGLVLDAERVDIDVAEIAGIDFSGDTLTACQGAFDAVLAANKVTFESGSATIDRGSGQTLDKLAAIGRRCVGLLFAVEGHTDSRGDRGFNISLSEERAKAVVDYLVSIGFSADSLDPVGYGPDQPVASNETRDGRAANRRIEFNVTREG